MVIWLIGMSASGKTTIGSEMIKILRRNEKTPWIFIDGDAFRNIMGGDLGHTVADRRKNAERICRLCSFLDKQGMHVLACVLSIFPEHQSWNQTNFTDYKQVYIQVDYEKLKQRDNKQLYVRAEKGEINDVVGVQIDFPEPINSDYVLNNNADNQPAHELAAQILSEIGLKPSAGYPYTKTNLLETPHKYQYSTFEGREFFLVYKQSRQEKIKLFKDNLISYHKTITALPKLNPDEKFIELLKQISVIAGKEFKIDSDDLLSILSAELWTNGYEKSFVWQPAQEHSFITRPFLLTTLQKTMTTSSPFLLPDERNLLLKLIQRFEVSKKIFAQYKYPEIRKIDNDYSDLLNFVLFHCALVSIHRLCDPLQSMVIENCLLKLGDILDSCFYRFFTPAQSLLAALSLQNELVIMEKKYGI